MIHTGPFTRKCDVAEVMYYGSIEYEELLVGWTPVNHVGSEPLAKTDRVD